MGLLGYAAKKAIQTAATKSVIRSIASAAVETIDAVSDAKAKAGKTPVKQPSPGIRDGDTDQSASVKQRRNVETVVICQEALGTEAKSTCSKCGASLRVSSDRTEFFCEYCGAKNYAAGRSVVVTHNEVDHARIREVESREAIRIKELELEIERIRSQSQRPVDAKKNESCLFSLLKLIIKVIGVLAAIWFGFMGLSLVLYMIR